MSLISEVKEKIENFDNLTLELISISEEAAVEDVEQISNSGYYSQNSIFVTARAAVDEILPSELLVKYSWSWTGKELRWRHQSPDENIDMLIGHIWKSWTENGELYLRFEVWGYDLRPELYAIQELVKTGELSISVGVKKTFKTDGSGELDAIYGRECSLTPNPACTPEMGCDILEISETLEKKDELKMSDNKALLDVIQTQFKEQKEIVQKFESTIVQNNKVLLESNERYENEIKLLSTKIKNQNVTIAEKNEEITKLKEQTAGFEAETEKMKTYEKRKKLVSFLNIADEKAREEKIASYEDESEDKLDTLIADAERIVKFNNKVKRSESNVPNIQNEFDNGSEGEESEIFEDPKEHVMKTNSSIARMVRDNALRRKAGGSK
jgi:hypothetical protein